MSRGYPVLGICGFSGSGKTTVIEKLIGILTGRGLKVGVVKHDGHGLNIDCEGKDTDRFFKAGADVVIRDSEQSFFRAHRAADMPLDELLNVMGRYYDLVFVEGHKHVPLEEKVWLCSDEGEGPPPEAAEVRRVLRRDEDRVGILMDMIDEWLPCAWRKAPVYAGILIGGRSSRFGRPKHLQEIDGMTWLERTMEKVAPHVDGTVILGAGNLPDEIKSVSVLCDAAGVKGPLAGMLAATRWMPSASWLFLPCDLPFLSGEAVGWLLEQRVPGAWAVLPLIPEEPMPEPLLAYYDLRSAPLLECVQRPLEIVAEPSVLTPVVPEHLQGSWKNVNTPEDLG